MEKLKDILGCGRFAGLAPLAPYGAQGVALRIFRGEMEQMTKEDLEGALKAIVRFRHSSRPTAGYGVESLYYGAREELASALEGLIRLALWERAGLNTHGEERLLSAYEDLIRAETLWAYLEGEGLLSKEARTSYEDAAERIGLRANLHAARMEEGLEEVVG